MFKNYLKIARFDHWVKQLFIVPGIVFALCIIDPSTWNWTTVVVASLLALLSTSFCASANYVINEWLDAEFDKFHPTKKERPVVAGGMKAKWVALEYIVFAVLGLVAAFFVSWWVFGLEVFLLVMGIFYNVKPMRTKEIAYLDVITESLNNAIRLLIGWFAVTSIYLPPISIIIGYWMGGAFLMATKRYAEYKMIDDKSTASLYRKSFAKYTETSLLISAIFYALVSVFFCGIFMLKYRIELIFAIPFVCGLFCYYLYLSNKPDSTTQKPEKLLKEKGLMLFVFVVMVVVVALMFIDMPFLQGLLDKTLISY